MKLNLVTAGTTFLACKKTFENLKGDVLTPCFIIVPDRFTLQAEDLLFSSLNLTATFNLNVMSLTRFVEKFIDDKKQNQGVVQSVLQIKKIIQENSESLKFYKKSNILFCYEIYKNIMQIKSSKMSYDELVCKSKKSAKLEDIALIFKLFEQSTQNFSDSTDLLDEFIAQLGTKGQGKKVVFAGFDSFTQANMCVLEACLKSFDEVTISLAKTNFEGGNSYIYEKDILEKINILAQKLNLDICVLSDEDDINQNQKAILDNLYSFNKKSIESNFCQISSSSSVLEEVEFFASLIKYKIFKGERFKNFSIAVSDLSKYQTVIERVFFEREIPFYIDSSENASGVLLELVLTMLCLKIKNFSNEDLLYVLSNPLIDFDERENLIAFVNENQIQSAEKFFKILAKQMPFIANFLKELDSCKKMNDYAILLKNLLVSFQERYDEYLEKMEEMGFLKEKNIAQQIPQILIETLSEFENLDEISLLDFVELFRLLVGLKNLSALPSFCDAVFVGDMTSSFFSEVDNMFVLGANAGELSKTVFDNGIFSDEELEEIGETKKIEPTVKMINRRNRFKLFNNLILARKNLYVSYLSQDEEGKKNDKALFVQDLMSIFQVKDVLVTSDIFYFGNEQNFERFLFSLGGCKKFASQKLMNYVCDSSLPKDFLSSLQSVLKFDFGKMKLDREKLSTQNLKDFFFKNHSFSASQIESFYDCPFKHFVNYGLRLSQKKSASLQQNESGSIVHSVLEKFVKEFGDKITNIDDEEILKFLKISIKKILEEEYSHVQNQGFLLDVFSKDLLKVCKKVVNELSFSQFSPLEIEEKVKVPLNFEDEKFFFKGKIDRVDSCGEDLRIIDYKTGKIDSNLFTELYYGKKLQLFLYSKILSLQNKSVSGVYYFDAKSTYEKDKKPPCLIGVTKSGEIEKIDNRLTDPLVFSSDIIKVVKKNGELVYDKMSSSQQTLLENYALEISKKAIEDILQGKIKALPNENSCKYCKYKGICLYDAKKGVRKISPKKMEDFENSNTKEVENDSI